MSSALRWLGVFAVLVLASGPASEAHSFALDASQMSGFKVLTAEDGVTAATNLAIIEYEGPITFPMAENLRAIWNEIAKDTRFKRVVLRLNSRGGTDIHGQEVIAVLAAMRERVTLTTLVGENDLCASMCIALYIQGEKRYASPASTWMFHGASTFQSNIPSLSMTTRYLTFSKYATSTVASPNFSSEITTSLPHGSRVANSPKNRTSSPTFCRIGCLPTPLPDQAALS